MKKNKNKNMNKENSDPRTDGENRITVSQRH